MRIAGRYFSTEAWYLVYLFRAWFTYHLLPNHKCLCGEGPVIAMALTARPPGSLTRSARGELYKFIFITFIPADCFFRTLTSPSLEFLFLDGADEPQLTRVEADEVTHLSWGAILLSHWPPPRWAYITLA